MKKIQSLQEARQQWVLQKIEEMNFEFPITELVEKTKFSKGFISSMLSGRYPVSKNFFDKFCESFGYDPSEVNHGIISDINKGVISIKINKNKKQSKIPEDIQLELLAVLKEIRMEMNEIRKNNKDLATAIKQINVKQSSK